MESFSAGARAVQLLSASARTRYAIALVSVAIGAFLRLGFSSFWSPFDLPFITFYPAVVLSAWLGGFGPGLLTTIVSSGLAAAFWMPDGFASSPRNLAALSVATQHDDIEYRRCGHCDGQKRLYNPLEELETALLS